jgi:hypothetical protein
MHRHHWQPHLCSQDADSLPKRPNLSAISPRALGKYQDIPAFINKLASVLEALPDTPGLGQEIDIEPQGQEEKQELLSQPYIHPARWHLKELGVLGRRQALTETRGQRLEECNSVQVAGVVRSEDNRPIQVIQMLQTLHALPDDPIVDREDQPLLESPPGNTGSLAQCPAGQVEVLRSALAHHLL